MGDHQRIEAASEWGDHASPRAVRVVASDVPIYTAFLRAAGVKTAHRLT
jgi:hypothetical protein